MVRETACFPSAFNTQTHLNLDLRAKKERDRPTLLPSRRGSAAPAPDAAAALAAAHAAAVHAAAANAAASLLACTRGARQWLHSSTSLTARAR